MKADPHLIALAEALADDPRGTPAGNSPLTQEQHAYLRKARLHDGDYGFHAIPVRLDPPCLSEIPAEHREPVPVVWMKCPVVGWHLVSPMLAKPLIVRPDGTVAIAHS